MSTKERKLKKKKENKRTFRESTCMTDFNINHRNCGLYEPEGFKIYIHNITFYLVMIQSQKNKQTVWWQFHHFFLSDEVSLFFIFPSVDFYGYCLFSYSFVKFGSYDHLYEPFFKIYVILSVVPKDILVTTEKTANRFWKRIHI